MINLQLDEDEGIVLQATEIEWYGEKEGILDEFILTNKNLLCSYRYKSGVFSKAEIKTDKISLSEIKVVKGNVQVKRINHDDYGDVMQVLLKDGKRIYFSFWKANRDIPIWVNAINAVITGDENPIMEEIKNNEKKELFDKKKIVQITDAEKSKHIEVVNVSHSGIDDTAEFSISFCSNCGDKLQDGANFCQKCGKKIEMNNNMVSSQVVKNEEKSKISLEDIQEKQEYLGTLLMCVHCGASINQAKAICPYCGSPVTGVTALDSVQNFKEQLMKIEATRKKSKFGMFSVYEPADPADKQKVALIRNYPIPNTIDDILEFMVLSITNIDVGLSKKTWLNGTASNMEILAGEMPRVISNAWVAKMQQMYQKAKIMFPDDPTFLTIQKLYFDKMAELKIKVK